jgi:hypothetical protein
VEDLAKLDAALWAEDAAGGGAPAHIAAITQTAAVHGLGGIGKSVLARQYAYENRERYAGVWSFAAETRPGITEGLIELGVRFIPNLDKVEDKQAAARHTLEFIADAGFAKPWLLIYDNIETPKTLDGLTPRSGAHILITTRWHNWQGRASPLELGKFSEAEAVAFLLKYTQRTDRDGAARLAEALGSRWRSITPPPSVSRAGCPSTPIGRNWRTGSTTPPRARTTRKRSSPLSISPSKRRRPRSRWRRN